MNKPQVPVSPDALADEIAKGSLHMVSPEVAYQRLAIVNVVFIGAHGAGDRKWVLVDAGIPGSRGAIERAAAERFGSGSRPSAIVMTHGHFDHVGALEALSQHWDCPVFAHPLELPYLRGEAAYPPPDPGVGGGVMARLSGLFPRGPVNVGERLQALPADGSCPVLPGWRWVHVPGHTPGQVALWRESDRTLISADAVITTRQESAYAVLKQEPELHGPPAYFTQDWGQSRDSARRLAALDPELLITGHGRAMQGGAMRDALHKLADRFDAVAVPDGGKYVEHPANPQRGNAYHPPDGA